MVILLNSTLTLTVFLHLYYINKPKFLCVQSSFKSSLDYVTQVPELEYKVQLTLYNYESNS